MKAKKMIAMLLALAMVLSLAACGKEAAPAETTPAETVVQPKDSDKVSSSGQILMGSDEDVEVNVSDVHMDAADANAAGNWEALFTPIEVEGRAINMKDFDLMPTAEELAAMQAEPAYNETIYYYMNSGCAAGITVAERLGYFEELGLKTEALKGMNDVEALGSGQVQALITHIATLLVPITNGIDAVFAGGAHQGCKSLYVLADSEYKTLADLKGTNVSVPNGIGGADYNICSMLLDSVGLDPMNDLEMIQVTADACVAAMQKGEISAAILSDVYAYGMVKDGTLRCVGSMLDSYFSDVSMCCAICLNGEFYRENPTISKKFVQAVQKAHSWMRDETEEATEFLLAEGLNNGDKDMNVMINGSQQFGTTNEYMEAQLREIATRYLDLGLITNMDNVDEIMALVWHPVLD